MKASLALRPLPACLTITLLAGLGLLIPVPAARAQGAPVPFGQGTHAFRRILHDFDLKPLASETELAQQPRDSLLIVLGETSILDRLPRFRFAPDAPFIESFVQLGGAVLIATDRTGQRWYWRSGQYFRIGGRLRVDPDSEHAFRKKHADCIEVFPEADSKLQLFPKPPQQPVWTNRPASLIQPPAQLPVLARLPPECRNERNFLFTGPPVFAVGGEWGARGGRILVLADHSIFINDMMLQPDTGNIDFTYNCVQWLTNNGKRTQVLFIEEGARQDSFDVPVKEIPPPPLPPAEVMVPIIDDTLKQLEDENVFNKVAVDVIDDMLERYFGGWLGRVEFLEGLALLLTLSLISFGITRLMNARQRIEIGTPLLANALARLTPSAVLVEQRQQAMLQSGNLWESARALARQCFDSVLDESAEGGRRVRGTLAPGPPPIRVLAGWWHRRRLQRHWDRLWRLAYGGTPMRVSPRHWAQLLGQIDEVETALADGIIQFESRETLRAEGSGPPSERPT